MRPRPISGRRGAADGPAPSPRRRRLIGTALLASALLGGCGGSDGAISVSDEPSSSAAESTSPTIPDATPTTVTAVPPPTVGEPPTTRIVVSDLTVDVVTDIEQVLGFVEGGDNLCSGVDGPVRPQPVLRDFLFRESTTMQIGWLYAFCWANEMPADDLRLVDPDGRSVPYSDNGAVLPGSPTGTYRVTATVGGVAVAADIEVVPTVDQRLFRLSNSSEPEIDLYAVGFTGRSTIPIAVYAGGDLEQTLIGTFEANLDDNGAGRIVVQADPALSGQCVHIVADPSAASTVESFDDGGIRWIDVTNPYVAVACLAAP